MIKYVDVTADPSAPEKAKLPAQTVSDALALGFDHEGWLASIFQGGARPMITGVYVHRTRRMILETSSSRFDSSSIKTLFDDGTIVQTETMPPKREWEMSRHGIFPHERHRIDFAVAEVSSLAALLEKHEERVREYEARGLTVWKEHDRRTAFAMKQRWREVADPRMKLQLKIALWIGGIVAAVVMIGAIVASRVAGQYGGALILLVLVGPPAGFAVFKWMFVVVAPKLATGAATPPPRPASELLSLADQVKTGFVAGQSAT